MLHVSLFLNFFVFISLLFVSTCKCYFVALVLLSLHTEGLSTAKLLLHYGAQRLYSGYLTAPA